MPESSPDASQDTQAPPPPPPPPAPVIQMPWENPGAGVREFFNTLWGIIRRPIWALSARPAASWPRWVGFAVGVWFLLFLAWQIFFFMVFPDTGLPIALSVVSTILGALFLPIQGMIALFIYGGAVYLTLKWLNKDATPPPFKLILRLLCYCQAAGVINVIPVYGLLLAPLWGSFLLCVGLHVGLGQTLRNAILGVVLPLMACLVLLYFLVGARQAGV